MTGKGGYRAGKSGTSSSADQGFRPLTGEGARLEN